MNLSDRDFERLFNFIRERYGINLKDKRTLVESRLAFDITQRGFGEFTTYVDMVTAFPDGDECQHMINRLSTNYTYFFRETDYINHLKSKAIPELIKSGRRNLSVWSAGCSSGQEAYSVAMALTELSLSSGFTFHITGTDINTDVLETARRGRYPHDDLKNIPAAYHKFLHIADDGTIEMNENIKARVSWVKRNLLDDGAKPLEYDLIFCRNVLIYFSQPTRKIIADILYDAMGHGGYLYTGIMETMDFRSRRFVYIAPSIYRKGEP